MTSYLYIHTETILLGNRTPPKGGKAILPGGVEVLLQYIKPLHEGEWLQVATCNCSKRICGHRGIPLWWLKKLPLLVHALMNCCPLSGRQRQPTIQFFAQKTAKRCKFLAAFGRQRKILRYHSPNPPIPPKGKPARRETALAQKMIVSNYSKNILDGHIQSFQPAFLNKKVRERCHYFGSLCPTTLWSKIRARRTWAQFFLGGSSFNW